MHRINQFSVRMSILLMVVAVVLVAGLSRISANDSVGQSIAVGDAIIGEISLKNITSTYTFSANSGDHISLRVQSLSPDFALQFDVKDSAGNLIAEGNQVNGQPTNVVAVKIPTPDTYTILIQSANGAGGQYTLSMQITPEASKTMLQLGDLVNATATGSQTDSYTFEVLPEGNTFLMVDSPVSEENLAFTLQNAATEETVAMFQLNVSGVCLRLAPVQQTYNLAISPEQSIQAQPYHLILWHSADASMACPSNMAKTSQPAPTENITASSCLAGPAGNQGVNVREYPNVTSHIVSQLNNGSTYSVMARSANGQWLMVNANGIVGWVAAPVTRVAGDCGSVTAVNIQTGSVTASTSTNGITNPTNGNVTLPTDNGSSDYVLCVTGDINNPTGGTEVCGQVANTVNGVINDPLGTVTDTVNGVINDPVGTVTDTVDGVINDPLGTVDDTATSVVDTVSNAVNTTIPVVNNPVDTVTNTTCTVSGLLGKKC